MSTAEPRGPYVYQPGVPDGSLNPRIYALAGPGAEAFDGKRFTRDEAHRELRELMQSKVDNLVRERDEMSAALRSMTTLRPMAEAPRDGTEILVAPHGGGLSFAVSCGRGWKVALHMDLVPDWLRDDTLIGWLPLPPIVRGGK